MALLLLGARPVSGDVQWGISATASATNYALLPVAGTQEAAPAISLAVSPMLAYNGERGRLRYSLRYQPTVSAFFFFRSGRAPNLAYSNGLSTSLSGDVGGRTEWTVGAVLTQGQFNLLEPTQTINTAFARVNNFVQIDSTASVAVELGARLKLRPMAAFRSYLPFLNLAGEIRTRPLGLLPPSYTVNTSADLTVELSRVSLGGIVSASWFIQPPPDRFVLSSSIAERSTINLQLLASASSKVTEQLSLMATAGASVSTQLVAPFAGRTTDVAPVGSLSLSYRLPRPELLLEAAYAHAAVADVVLARFSNVDSVSLRVQAMLTTRLAVDLNGGYRRSVSSTRLSPGPPVASTFANILLSYAMTENLGISVSYQFSAQLGSVGLASEFIRHVGAVSLLYRGRPFR